MEGRLDFRFCFRKELRVLQKLLIKEESCAKESPTFEELRSQQIMVSSFINYRKYLMRNRLQQLKRSANKSGSLTIEICLEGGALI